MLGEIEYNVCMKKKLHPEIKKYFSKIGKEGSDAANKIMTKAQKIKRAKKAAKARWGK